MNPALRSRVTFFGHIGYDIYLAGEEKVYVRPAGSAYNAAVAVLAVGGSATFVCSSSPSLNRKYLDKFKGSNIRFVERVTSPGPEHIFVFDLRAGQRSEPLLSMGQPCTPPVEYLEQEIFDDLHIHLGTMTRPELIHIWKLVQQLKPSSSLSCNLYEPYLGDAAQDTLAILERARIVFVNLSEFEYVRAHGWLASLLHDRMLVITCGGNGVICFVDGVPIAAYTPQHREVVCATGAGDVFAGAFLSLVLSGHELSQSLAVAAELASCSVCDYGVEAVPAVSVELSSWAENCRSSVPNLEIAGPENFTGKTTNYSTVIEATGLFVIRAGKLLLVKKPDERSFFPNLLYVPGGKLEPGETPEACARRELMEETGLTGGSFAFVSVFHFPHPQKTHVLYRFYQFVVTNTEGEPAPSDDVADCLWQDLASVRREELFDLTWAQIWLLRQFGLKHGAREWRNVSQGNAQKK